MDENEAQRQIQQMVNFILNEAKDKAEEIEANALQDYNIEKLRLVQQMKDKIRSEFQKKAKQVEVQRSIARSTAINRARLKKIAARNQVVNEVVSQAQQQLARLSQDKNRYNQLILDLIVQALLKLLEDNVILRCRQCDVQLIEAIIPQATAKYSAILKQSAGVTRNVKITVDKQNFLAPPPTGNDAGRTCSGGVVVMSTNLRITCDNTLDARLNLVVEECKPIVRQTLFPLR
eukprot:GDKI01019161.1.p1 GENE.GDKI01019161.1~~GDKI01019161.1.p1  ORF type:complete len:258 (-),score=96.50 GDKI01019161.1:43-741(-)